MSLLDDVKIEVSRRHVHLSRDIIDLLFGQGHELTCRRVLTAGTDFAAEETVDIVNGDRSIKSVRVVGPERGQTQVELSKSDADNLNINPPVRLSGVLDGTPGIRMVGPAGEVDLDSGVIIAQKHIHVPSGDAEKLGITDCDILKLEVEGENGAIFHDVVARVADIDTPVVHIDSDEAGEANISREANGLIKK